MSRSVLVTGASGGIGLAVATAFAKNGDRVAVTYRHGKPPEGLLAVACDVTHADEVDAAFEAVEAEQGPVEVLVANAGVTRDTLLLRMTDEEWLSVIDTNLTGSYRVARRAARSMLRNHWGRLVFISSIVGLLGSGGQSNYAASKAGLIGFARSLAREMGSRNITSNVVMPGFVETRMTADLSAVRKGEILEQIPVGRFATAEEIAAVVRFLGSEEASYVNGAVMPVDGGLGMGH